MKIVKNILIYSIPFVIVAAIIWGIYGYSNSFSFTPPPETNRQIVQLPISIDAKNRQTLNVEAYKLPEFSLDLTANSKLKSLIDISANQIKEKVTASIVHEAYASEKLETEVTIDREKSSLVVHPKDIPNFKPGKYRLHLQLRTIEGTVNVEQDFTWGVIAVNTNRSIYRPGDAALISMGVLNDKGETHCMTGEQRAKVWLTITDPNGVKKEYSTEDNSIKDSGKCGPITVTNEADFQALFLVETPGVHQMKVVAEINGLRREIEDYFKVSGDVAFDVERSSFPTRIYPHAPYNVSFKITPQENYSGKVEEIVPKNFKISKISNNGKEETQGEFKKIVWQVNLQKGQTQEYRYTINFPLISPEFYLLGPIKIGDFEEARQWQVASDAINSTTGLVTYEDNNGSNTFSRVWTGTAWNPAPPTAGSNIDPNAGGGDDFPDDSRWFVEKSSPKTGEKLVAAYDNCGAPISNECIWMYRWTGTAWAEEDFVISVATPDTNSRVMDISYEENSGDALFVYGDNTNQLKYRKRVSGTWDGSSSNAGTFSNALPKWVKAKAQFRSDDILVAFQNANNRIGALIWNGTTNAFGNQFDDNDTTPAQTETPSVSGEAFDIAWETQSGTPMIFWGDNAGNIRYREFTGGAWSGETVLYANPVNNIEWLTASSDPRSASNYIAIAAQESDFDAVDEASTCWFGMWDGDAGVTPTSGTCRSDLDGRLNTVQFENSTGTAVWAFVLSSNTLQLSWRTWDDDNPTVFSSVTTETGNSTSAIESLQLHSDLNTESMIALYAADSADADTDPDLYHREWDGSSWSALGTSLYGRIQGAGEAAEAYGFGFDRNLETMAAYAWFTNTDSVTPGTALAAQDTPYTLTQANQQFRLRLLLYYPDSLATSGRNYRLQFVDPGTGTCEEPTGGTPAAWTNVGAPGSGAEISFYNNTTPADGDNIATVTGDPTYSGKTVVNQDYEEGNTSLTFTNTVSAMSADQVGKWDFALVDNTTFDATSQSFCFRVVRDSNNLVLQIATYPKITTAALNDVLIQGGSLIQGATLLQ